MDEAMKAVVLVLAALCSVIGAARAQSITDPTQPPAAFTAPQPVMGAPAAPLLPQLQSVLISSHLNGRRVAVIDGQTVPLGAHFGNAVLIKMTETEVVLRRGNQLQTLKLRPAPGTTAKP